MQSRLDDYIDSLTELETQAEIHDTVTEKLLDCYCDDIAPLCEDKTTKEILRIGIDLGIKHARECISWAQQMEKEVQEQFGIDVLDYITETLVAPQSNEQDSLPI